MEIDTHKVHYFEDFNTIKHFQSTLGPTNRQHWLSIYFFFDTSAPTVWPNSQSQQLY